MALYYDVLRQSLNKFKVKWSVRMVSAIVLYCSRFPQQPRNPLEIISEA